MTIKILIGDVREKLRELPDDHFDCVVTSPPYWGLRDYGVAGQLGLEPTLGEHIDVMVEVFADVHRVLKPTGTLWLNYGDCYATTPNGRSAADTKAMSDDDRTFRDKPFSTIGAIYDPSGGSKGGGDRRGESGNKGNGGDGTVVPKGRIVGGGTLKAKDLCMIPNRLAIALQEWGWWVRSEIIWAKPNPMPESIRDRPATSHEKIFMLTKSPRYFYAADDVRQGAAESSMQRWSQNIEDQEGSTRANGGAKTNGPMKAVGGPRSNALAVRAVERSGGILSGGTENSTLGGTVGSRSLRNWEPAPLQAWVMGTSPFSDAHFATFPPELVERALTAGCPKGGLVLDPFGGAGTTALVADQMQLDATIIELNPAYVHIALRRIETDRGAISNALDPVQVDLLAGVA